MRNFRLHFSFVRLCTGTVGMLFVTYLALIAVVMSYASLTIEFSQSIKNTESSVAVLESQYLASVAQITTLNYTESGYVTPLAKQYVHTKSVTAVR